MIVSKASPLPTRLGPRETIGAHAAFRARKACSLRKIWRAAVTIATAGLIVSILARPTQDAVANGETRSLNMVHMHTGESISITYMQNGRYDSEALKKLNYFLRDWRRDEPTRMDPRLFDTVWLAYQAVGAREPINVVCGYRAPETNEMLRRRSRGVAKFSQHTLGKALDFYIPGVQLASLRAAGLRLQRGGVGFYPTSGSPFVHMDSGSVRMWPRMTRAQLAAVFPDGKTVHIPTDGKPMPGYQAAYAELRRNGGSAGGFQGGGDEDGGGFALASLFGGGSPGTQATQATLKASESPQAVLLADAQRRSQAPGAVASAIAAKPTPEKMQVAALAETASEAETAPVLAHANVPLPEPRPSELASPQMVWQAGPPGLVASANVPLPPMRPGAERSADGPAGVAALTVDPETTASTRSNVLQPSAPMLADLSQGANRLLKRNDTGSLPTRALGFASADAPQGEASRQAHSTLVATRFERLDFAAVAAPVSSSHDMTQAGLTRPDLDTVQTLFPKPTKLVVIRFGVAAYHDLRAEKFSGVAIKPLRTASFSVMPAIFTGALASSN
jgi:uncharacterized protein YcbK (DUF882 family)